MPKVKFYRDRRSNTPTDPVFLVLCHAYKKKSNYEIINASVPGSMWNDKAKGSPDCIKGTSEDSIELRDRLKTIKHQIEVEIPDFLSKEYELSKRDQTIDHIFNELLKRNGLDVKEEKKPKKYITEYIEEYIKIHKTLEETNKGKYRRLKATMEEFAEKNGMSLLLSKIDYPWLSMYCNYLTEPKEGQKWGYENGYIDNLFRKLNSTMNYYELKPFKIKKILGHLKKYTGKETDRKDLDVEDVLKFYSFDCTMDGKVKMPWLKVRDTYVWSCFLGHRHNELYALTKYCIDERLDVKGNKYKVIKYVSDKTGEPNEVVLNDICLEIIERWSKVEFEVIRNFRGDKQQVIYKDPLLPVMSTTLCSKYLREVMEEIAFRDSKVVYGEAFSREAQHLFEPVSFYRTKLRVRYVGALRKEENIPMWQWYTFKTSRTTTACVLSNNGVSDADISSVLNNEEETVRKHYTGTKNRSIVNQRNKSVMDQAVRNASGI